MLAASKYEEDNLNNGHTAVWGSFYCVATHRWGYACCLLCDRHAECGKVEVPALEGPSGSTDASEGRGDIGRAQASTTNVANDAEEAAPNSARCAAELARILATGPKKPFEVLGLSPSNATCYAVRNAFRRLALLVHPDKNPGDEERCHRALLRAQGAREAALALLSAPPAAAVAEKPEKPRPTVSRPRERAPGKEPQKRSDFESAEAFVVHALQYVLDEWYRFVDLALGGPDAQKRKEASARRAATAAAATGGAEGVLRSEVALQQTTKSVKALSKLLGNQELGSEIVAKVERVCRGMLEKEYAHANQAYMDLAIGNKAWHTEVPTLMEGGMDGLTGIERGRMWKQ
ncbi:SLU7, partial [Symbiodinium natans]